MRPVNKSSWPTKGKRTPKPLIFNSWKNAIPHLVGGSGKFCHFCEMRVTNALAIEHIMPKEHYPRLRANWNNFILICNYCNSHKGDTIPVSPYKKNYYWPHLNNTLKAFDFNTAAVVVPNIAVLTTNLEIQRAQNTINLYGLSKTNNSRGESDNRWLERARALVLAIDCLQEYQLGMTTIRNIVEFAESTGFFSVWLKIFNGISAVRTALINHPGFHLSLTNCFDSSLQLQNRTATDL